LYVQLVQSNRLRKKSLKYALTLKAALAKLTAKSVGCIDGAWQEVLAPLICISRNSI
jgi:hypothetical protein